MNANKTNNLNLLLYKNKKHLLLASVFKIIMSFFNTFLILSATESSISAGRLWWQCSVIKLL